MISLSTIEFSRREKTQWFLIVLVVKVMLFAFFILFRNTEWPAKDLVGGMALYSGDAPTYYGPLESFMQGEGYQSVCRMPGLLPFYAPLRAVMSAESAQIAITFVQLLFDVMATLLLAMIAARLFGDRRVFYATIVVYGISTFVSVRSNYLLSDSFNTSLLIIAVYFLTQFFLLRKNIHVLLAGVFLAWSLFFRPVVLLAYPCMMLLLLYHRDGSLKAFLKPAMIFMLPTIVALSAWTARNVMVYDRTIVLIAGTEECMSRFTPQQQAVRELVIAMGEDFQPWSRGSGAEWFMQPESASDEKLHPFSPNDFTSAYNLDSLITLRFNYRAFRSLASEDQERELSPEELVYREKLGQQVISSAHSFAASYRSEHAFRYHILNRIHFIRMFLFPSRLDDLPLPASADMNILQKAVKAGSYVLLLLVNALACIAMLWFLVRRKWLYFFWGLLPFAFVVGLGYLGFIEQRYLTPAYPFMVLLACGFVLQLRRPVSETTSI